MNMKIKVLTLLCCSLLSGCAARAAYNSLKQDYNHPPLDPPPQNRWLTIDGVIPPEVRMQIVSNYYSTKGCTRNSGDLATYFDLIYPKPGHYSVQIALDGGTRCGWQLESIDISSKINDPNYYNARIPIVSQFTALESAAATHTFKIMEAEDVSQMGKVNMTRQYYPYAALLEINRSNPASEIKSTLFLNNLNGRRQSESNFYYQPSATSTPLGFIHFSPLVDHDYLVYSTEEGSQLKGSYAYRYYYPNGDITENEPLRGYRYYEIKPKKKDPWKPIIPD
ncbi:hypothetical protein HNP12_004497 [Aeromonas hydrophila]|uniref:hypothetical protein n=1 Tax=Aeromonas hydrophila TaxID=644 RepID=UPI0021697CDF|nr:hypothetical protein [Aeromonas hydrophila]MCS3770357.1 hypothetical protein [Aeromonas hydrophila]MCS3793708.1 hypothetical protein [Aeromonas hydrophila]